MLSHPLVYRYNWIYFLLCCLSLGGFLFLNLNQADLSLEGALYDSLSSAALLAIMLIYLVITLSFYHPYKYVLVFIGSVALLLSILFSIIIEMLYPLYYDAAEILRLGEEFFWPRFMFTALLFVGSTSVAWFYFRVKDLESGLARQEEADKASKDAELYKLRQQLQPHFLFNSLNSINALIGSKPEQARKMVLQLSDFFRGTLRREESKFIPLSEELDYIRLYLEIEQVRFGHRLQATIDVSNDLLSIPVPPLVLQPIMENAIKFGLYGTIGEVCIKVQAQSDDHFLHIAISNPYDSSSSQVKGTGFGLAAVKRRLYLLFARNDLLETRTLDELFTAYLKFPLPHD